MDKQIAMDDDNEGIESSDEEPGFSGQAEKSVDRVGGNETSLNSNLRPVTSDDEKREYNEGVTVSDEESSEQGYASKDPAKRDQGLMLRLKKSISSKTMSTRLGRKTISHFIGEGGVNLLNSFKNSAKKDKGDPYSKQLKRRVLRTAVKTKLLLDSKDLTLNDFGTLNRYSLNLLKAVQRALKVAEEQKQEVSVSDIESLSEMFSQFTVEIVLLLRPYLKGKNIDKLQETLNYWGGRHFLTIFMNTEAHKPEREISIQAINSMFKDQPNVNATKQG
jgi:hypothetical protein